MKAETPNISKVSPKAIVLIFLLLAGIGIIVLLQVKDDTIKLSGRPRLGKGVRAPDFTLSGLDGKPISLADYQGKVVLLNIWATWCPPCVKEMPSMERLHQAMKGADFAILAVNIDASGAEAVRPFMKKHRLSFTALVDPKGAIRSLYQTTGVPENFIIDKNGMIVEKVIGPRDWASPGAVRFFRDLVRVN